MSACPLCRAYSWSTFSKYARTEARPAGRRESRQIAVPGDHGIGGVALQAPAGHRLLHHRDVEVLDVGLRILVRDVVQTAVFALRSLTR
jgi:hypothetical protein